MRDGQRLRVVPAAYPARGNARTWNQDYSITLRAYESPMWEDEAEKTLVKGVAAGAHIVTVPGSASTVLSAEATGRLTAATISTGDSSIRLEGLEMEAGDTLTIDHDAHGRIIIAVNGDSVLDKRTPASSDDLTIQPGRQTIAI